MTSKEFYAKRHHPQTNLSKANIRLYNEILNYDPKSVFEFGCNVGRHLKRLEGMGIKAHGIDLSQETVRKAIHKRVKWGDENVLKELPSNKYGVCFTNSVLCHIPDGIEEIVEQLKRIGKKAVIINECVTKTDPHWYIHDYEKLGFKKIMEIQSHRVKDATYNLCVLPL